MRHNTRSTAFDEYLLRQPPARRKELLAAERRFEREHAGRLSSEEQIYQESFQGYEDVPAGPARSFDISELAVGGGDWSWQPQRYEQDPGRVFTPEEIDALYPNRVYFPGARVSCG